MVVRKRDTIKKKGAKMAKGGEFEVYGAEQSVIKRSREPGRWKDTVAAAKAHRKLAKETRGAGVSAAEMRHTQLTIEAGPKRSLMARILHVQKKVEPIVPGKTRINLNEVVARIMDEEAKAERAGIKLDLRLHNWGFDEKKRLVYMDTTHRVPFETTPPEVHLADFMCDIRIAYPGQYKTATGIVRGKLERIHGKKATDAMMKKLKNNVDEVERVRKLLEQGA